MEKFDEMGIEPKIKKEIMEEGFEEEAAVLIGKKEEMPGLLEKLEKEGRAENLATYIKMHKEIVLPKEEIGSGLKEKIKTGLAWHCGGGFASQLYFADKKGNIAKVGIIPEKIASLKESPKKGRYFEDAEKELTEYGFDLGPEYNLKDPAYQKYWEILNDIAGEIDSYNRKIEEQMKQKKKEEFDF